MHVTVLDEARKQIGGLEAWYGWGYDVAVNEKKWSDGYFRWWVWPSGMNVAHKDPQSHLGPGQVQAIMKR